MAIGPFSLMTKLLDDPIAAVALAGVLGLGAGGESLARRVDAGALSGARAFRYEPEPYLGQEEVFHFYNVGGELRRPARACACRTEKGRCARTRPADVPGCKNLREGVRAKPRRPTGPVQQICGTLIGGGGSTPARKAPKGDSHDRHRSRDRDVRLHRKARSPRPHPEGL
jgi:hypothetical protein